MADITRTHPSSMSLADTRHAVATVLGQFFARSHGLASTIDPTYAWLWQTFEHVSMAGGKRMRPHLTFIAYQGLGGEAIDDIVSIGAGEELLHIAMLIHDDIIDRDHARHGEPNVTGHYLQHYAVSIENPKERLHFANCAALLAGNLGISGAHQLVNKSGVSLEQKLMAHDLLGEAIFNVSGGELLDTEASFMPVGTFDPLKIYRYKTASYSFVSPLVMGARLAHADDATIASLSAFGEQLGIAFQLADDLLGVFGDAATTGKSNTSDLEEGKLTYLTLQCQQLLTEQDRSTFNSLFGKQGLTVAQAYSLRTIIVNSGAKQHTENLINHYAEQARDIIQSIDSLNSPARQSLQELIGACTLRNK